jgi:hypothetical protein
MDNSGVTVYLKSLSKQAFSGAIHGIAEHVTKIPEKAIKQVAGYPPQLRVARQL